MLANARIVGLARFGSLVGVARFASLLGLGAKPRVAGGCEAADSHERRKRESYALDTVFLTSVRNASIVFSRCSSGVSSSLQCERPFEE